MMLMARPCNEFGIVDLFNYDVAADTASMLLQRSTYFPIGRLIPLTDKPSVDPVLDESTEGPPVTGYRRLITTSRRFYVLTALVGLIATFVIFYQTETCLVLLGKMFVSQRELDEHRALSKKLRAEVTKSCVECPPTITIVPHDMFDERQRKLILRATNELSRDPNVTANFPKFDELTFDDTRAVVVPLWKLGNHLDWYQMGLTPAGAICGQEDSENPMGVTIRENPGDQDCRQKVKERYPDCPTTHDGKAQLTRDGTPRIALNSEVINDETFKNLKYTLLHEAIHAQEVPGFRPPLSRAHSDLSYLPAYNQLMSALQLESNWSIDYILWLFALGAFALTLRHAQLAILAGRQRPLT